MFQRGVLFGLEEPSMHILSKVINKYTLTHFMPLSSFYTSPLLPENIRKPEVSDVFGGFDREQWHEMEFIQN